MFKKINNEILTNHPQDTNGLTHYCLYRQLQASYNAGDLTIELQEPVIPDTQWQGALISENREVDIIIDGELASTETLNQGELTVTLDLTAGEHVIEVRGDLCQSAEVTVTM